MVKLGKAILSLVFALSTFSGAAQNGSPDVLPAVDINDSLQSPLSGSFQFEIDSIHPHLIGMGSMDQLLTERSAIFFKSNGPGLLSTPSIRGGDAGNTNVLWNGIPIRSAMLGVIDFTTLGTSDMTSVQVTSGSSSNLYGSGGNGGIVHLKTDPDFKSKSARVNLGLGSFGRRSFSTGANVPVMIGKVPVVLRMSNAHFRSKNEFEFTDIYAHPYEQRLNTYSNYVNSNISAMISAMLRSDMLVTFNYWRATFDREVPSPINIPQTVAHQGDTVTRYQLHLAWEASKRLQLKQTLHYEQNTNHFRDSSININNSNQFYTVQSLTNSKLQLLPNIAFIAQISSQWTEARSGNYDGFEQRWLNEGLTMVKSYWFRRRLGADAGYRYISANTSFFALPFFSLSYKPWKQRELSIYSSGSATARIPTLNELYWNPGGNANLSPERGVNAEVGLRGTLRNLHFNGAGFYGSYEDRIRWLPNGSIFTPVNIAYSEVYGAEFRGSYSLKGKRWGAQTHVNLSYTEAFGKENPQSELYRVSYVPRLNANASLELRVDEWTMGYFHQFTSQRFITNDESVYMPSFDVASARFFWNPNRSICTLGLTVDNLYNVDYQNIPWRPTPGRSYAIIIQFRWKE